MSAAPSPHNDARIEAAADALDRLARIGRGLRFTRQELREAASAALNAAAREEAKQKP